MGLRPPLPQRGRTRRRLPRLPPSLQSPPRPHRTQRRLTRQPRTQPEWAEQLGQAVCRSCSPSAISSTSLSQNAGRSLGTRLLTRPLSTTTSSSTQVAPALDRSVFRLG